VRTEIRVLQNSTHRHIVNIEGWSIANASNVVYIFMEFCNGGDLQKLINTHQRSRSVDPFHFCVRSSMGWRPKLTWLV
jgi:serine/threonine protein kinase